MNRLLSVLGLSAVLTVGILVVAWRLGLPVGHLPGDIHREGEGHSFHFPVATCVLASVLWSLLATLVSRWLR